MAEPGDPMGERIRITTADGTIVATHRSRATPSTGRGGVVLLHDWWGPSATWHRVADELAAEGYTALVPDLYDGYRPETPLDAMRRLMDLDVEAAVSVVRAAVKQLEASAATGALRQPIALMGFSLGGQVAMLAAQRGVPCEAVVSFYGAARKGEVRAAASMSPPLQLHLCHTDAFFSPARQQQLANALATSSADREVHWYDAAHGFFDSARTNVYDAQAAAQSWSRALAFIATHLSPAGD